MKNIHNVIEGSVIRQAREQMGHSQYSLARVLGVTRGAVSSWEQGRGNPRFATLQRLIRVLDLEPPQWFFQAITTTRHGEAHYRKTLTNREVDFNVKF